MEAKVVKIGTFAKNLTDYEIACLEAGDNIRFTISGLQCHNKKAEDFERIAKAGAIEEIGDNGISCGRWHIDVAGAEGFNKVAQALDGFLCAGSKRIH